MCSLCPAHTSLSLLHSHSLSSSLTPLDKPNCPKFDPSWCLLPSHLKVLHLGSSLSSNTHILSQPLFLPRAVLVLLLFLPLLKFQGSDSASFSLSPHPSHCSVYSHPNESHPGSPTVLLTLETDGTALTASSSFPMQHSRLLQIHNRNS